MHFCTSISVGSVVDIAAEHVSHEDNKGTISDLQ